MTMGVLRMHIFYRRWLLLGYAFVTFTILLYMIGYSSKYRLMGIIGWSESEITVASKTIPCFPRQNIVFLKTHKCASTSVQNILMRYANQRNLTVVVPVLPNSHYLSLVKPFRKEMIAGAPWEILGYNIFCHHMVFDKPEVAKVMPKDSLYISIVRDPVRLFESLYEYDEMQDFYKMDIEEYARGTKNATIAKKLRIRSNGMGRNQMLYDLGVHPAFFNNLAMIQKAVTSIDNTFDFIMIAEYFDESIVILRHILCWDLEDVISLTVNARMNNYKKNLTDEAAKNLQEWNWADKILYDYFLQKFHETVEEFGRERLRLEVEELRRKREEWLDYCVEKKVEAKDLTAYKIWSNKVSGYMLKPNMKNQTCEDLVKPEKYFTSEIRQRQLLRSLMKSKKKSDYGPIPLRHLIDLKVLNSNEQEIAKNMLITKYKRKKYRSGNKDKFKEKT